MVRIESEALETTEMLPLAVPADCGELCPPAKLTLEPPELVRVSDRVWFFPICKFPKLRVDGLAASDPPAPPARRAERKTVPMSYARKAGAQESEPPKAFSPHLF